MGNRAYIQLVLLTERPGARIGRVLASELSEAERTVATMLDWIEKSWHVYVSNDEFPLGILLRSETHGWWAEVIESMWRIGASKTARRLRRVLGILNLPAEPDPTMRAALIDNLDERRRTIAQRGLWPVWHQSLYEPLMQFVFANADTIPGAESLKDMSVTP